MECLAWMQERHRQLARTPIADHADMGPWLASHFREATPFRLVSLLDMLQIYAEEFRLMMATLAELREGMPWQQIHRTEAGAAITSVDDGVILLLQARLNDMQPTLVNLDMKTSLKHLVRMQQEIDTVSSFEEVLRFVQELEQRIHDELEDRIFLSIQAGDAIYYNNKCLFGEDVARLFPTAVFDIEEAGKCLACGRYTAAIFHLMRILEDGVHKLGSKLVPTVSLNNLTWGTMLQQHIQPAIRSLPTTTKEETEYRDKCQDIHASLCAVKDAWRNPTMHKVATTYTEEAAKEIFVASRTFMRKLALII